MSYEILTSKIITDAVELGNGELRIKTAPGGFIVFRVVEGVAHFLSRDFANEVSYTPDGITIESDALGKICDLSKVLHHDKVFVTEPLAADTVVLKAVFAEPRYIDDIYMYGAATDILNVSAIMVDDTEVDLGVFTVGKKLDVNLPYNRFKSITIKTTADNTGVSVEWLRINNTKG